MNSNQTNVNKTGLPVDVHVDVSATPVVLIAICVSVAVIAVLVIIVACVIMKKKRQRKGTHDEEVSIPLTEKVKPNNTDDSKSEADSELLSEVKLQQNDNSYYCTKQRFTVEEMMKYRGTVALIGPAGSGKTCIGYSIMSSLQNKKVSQKKYTCRIITRIGDWEEAINPRKITILFFDSCFENWHSMPTTIDADMKSLAFLQEELTSKKDLFAIFTFRPYTWDRYCSKLSKNVAISEDCILKLNDDSFIENEKINILARHFQHNNIVCCDNQDDENVYQALILDKRQQGKMHTNSFKELIQVSSKMPTSIGYVGTCALMCNNRRLLQKAKDFVLDPCGVLRKDLTLMMKSKVEEDRQKFSTLVYAALNGGKVVVGKEDGQILEEIWKAIRPKNGARKRLVIDDDYFIETGIHTFEFQQELVLRTVLFVFGEQNPELLINHCNADLLLRYMRTKNCEILEDEHVLVLRKDDNYKYLAQRFLKILDNPDNDDVRNHVCMGDDKFKAMFAKYYSREFEGRTNKANPTLEKVRISVRNKMGSLPWGQQTKL